MVKINLLPWREERRQQLTKEYYVLLGVGAFIAAAIIGAVYYVYSHNLDFQKKRNSRLDSEIQILNGKIKDIENLEKDKESLLARKKVIEELQANRTQMVHLFDELVKTIPNGVFLENIKQNGNMILMEGYAQSHSRVSSYMRQIEKSEWFKPPEVEFIRADETFETHEQKFRLSAQLINPLTKNPEDDEEGAEE